MPSKKVLITGADGFIGSHLTEFLLKNNYDIRAFCLYNSNGSWGWIDTFSNEIKKNIEIYMGDVRDFQSVKESMRGCDIVFHLASLIAIPYSYKAPSSYIQTNIQGTLNIVQAATELGIEKVIHTSTSETYGSAQFVPINETHPLVGQSPYAASKIGADQIALSFWHSFKTPISIIRPFNTYGPRQSCRAVIPTIITQISAGKKNINLGSISPTRDFNYVIDTCKAFLEISKSEKAIGKVINSASNFEISIEDTVKVIAKEMNTNVNIISDEKRVRPKNSEVNRLFGDNKLLKELTGWVPEFDGLEGFKKGLNLTIEWFENKKNLSFYRTDEYMI